MKVLSAPLLRQITTELLFDFQESWKGRKIKDAEGKTWTTTPKSDIGKDRDQGLMRKFFQWCRKNKYISEDPCENLERIGCGDSIPKPFTPDEEQRIIDAIEKVFPKKHEYVHALILLQKYSGGRISAVATAEVGQLEDDGIWLRERKGERDGPPKSSGACFHRRSWKLFAD